MKNDPTVSTSREAALPLWVKTLLDELRGKVEVQRQKLETLSTAHVVLIEREWFTIPGAPKGEDEPRTLFFLNRNAAQSVCTLYDNDVLLIGRSLHRYRLPSPEEER